MKIIIIGNGIAGTNAARYIRKLSDHEVLMISDETLQPYSRTALMYIYMGHLRQADTHLYEDWFWEKNRIERVKARVTQVDSTQKVVHLDNQQSLKYDKLIIATGSKPNKFGWPGQDLDGVTGLYNLQDLERIEQYTQGIHRAIVVGGGLIGIELVEMLHSRRIPVTFLVREDSFWNMVLPAEESAMINRHIKEHGIELRLGTELAEIKGDNNGRVAQVILKDGVSLDAQFVGFAVGVSPNIDFLKNSDIAINRGVLVDEYLTSSQSDVYAIGDCAELRKPDNGRRAIEAIWYTGRMAGQTVAHTICRQATVYKPRLWYNSAKFLDIEYQVYGDIPVVNPADIQSIYWEHPSGKKSIRINYNINNQSVTGFNLMGIRYRHDVCEKWILEKTSIEIVLKNLSLANFDPEFFKEYESEVLARYTQITGKKITLESKRNLDLVTRFLKGIK